MKQILLVDDAVDFLKILAQALEQDFEVYTATGVSEAMSLVETTAGLHIPIFSQAAGSMLTLPTLTGRRRNAWNGS